MKKKLLLIMLFFGATVSIYASFPVIESVESVDPVVSDPSNWMAIVGLSCGILAWIVSWLFAIPGAIFGWLGTRGDKSMKWAAWVGYGLSAAAILLVTIAMNA